MHTSAPELQHAWAATRRVSKDDWLEWLKGLSIEFLKFSSSPALRLVPVYYILGSISSFLYYSLTYPFCVLDPVGHLQKRIPSCLEIFSTLLLCPVGLNWTNPYNRSSYVTSSKLWWFKISPKSHRPFLTWLNSWNTVIRYWLIT
jgi:hypothetical protein